MDTITAPPAHAATTTPEPVADPLLVTIAEAATMLAVGERTCWRLVSLGRLPVVKIGRATRVRVRDLQRIAERGVADLSEVGR